MLASDIRSGTNANIALRKESRRNVSDPVLRKRRQASRRQQRRVQVVRQRKEFEKAIVQSTKSSMFGWARLLWRRGIDLKASN